MATIVPFTPFSAPVHSLVNHSDHGVVEVLDRRGDERQIEAVIYDAIGECQGAELIWVRADSLVPVRDHINITGVELFHSSA